MSHPFTGFKIISTKHHHNHTVDTFGSPSQRYIHPHPIDCDGDISHVHHERQQFEAEGGTSLSGARDAREEAVGRH